MKLRSTLAGVAAGLLLALVFSSGCRKPVYFPAESAADVARSLRAAKAYDADLDGKVDFFLFANAAGRIDRIGYDTDADQRPDEIVPLDAIPFSRCRHLVLILDGVTYGLVREFYDAGHLRVFHPPSRVVAPYPAMTDLAIQDALGGMAVRGFEAKCYDRKDNRIVGGADEYMNGLNEPYNRLLQYRAAKLWDAIGYVDPWAVFGKEINDAKRTFDRGRTVEVIGYFVSSAGVGTRMGAEGHRMCLAKIEQFVNQVIWESRGLTKVTLLSDHGHTYAPSTRIDFEKYLRGKGYRPTSRLRGADDVVQVKFGLVTFGSFATSRKEDLARDLTDCDGVELASFARDDEVVVLAAGGGRAVVSQKAGRYKYQPQVGDPLKLRDILSGLTGDADGYYDADALLAATIDHEYPAPLQRLWRAHFALVRNTPDVIVSLRNDRYAGLASFAGRVTVASTHGGLRRENSVAFIMSTAGPLPPFMRSRDIPKNMKVLTGCDFPMRK